MYWIGIVQLLTQIVYGTFHDSSDGDWIIPENIHTSPPQRKLEINLHPSTVYSHQNSIFPSLPLTGEISSVGKCGSFLEQCIHPWLIFSTLCWRLCGVHPPPRTTKICIGFGLGCKGQFPLKKNFHGQKIFRKYHVKSWKFSTSNIFSDGKFVSANHILQNFVSAENFPEWKWWALN